jgi:hypothetical protein
VGAASFEATTEVNTDNHTVLLFNINVTNTYFPGQVPATTPQFDQLFRSFVPLTLNASLARLVAYMPKPQSVKTVNLGNDPPFILLVTHPAILLGVDGEPVLSEIPKTDSKFVVNTPNTLDNDPLDQKIRTCAGSPASMATATTSSTTVPTSKLADGDEAVHVSDVPVRPIVIIWLVARRMP